MPYVLGKLCTYSYLSLCRSYSDYYTRGIPFYPINLDVCHAAFVNCCLRCWGVTVMKRGISKFKRVERGQHEEGSNHVSNQGLFYLSTPSGGVKYQHFRVNYLPTPSPIQNQNLFSQQISGNVLNSSLF